MGINEVTQDLSMHFKYKFIVINWQDKFELL